MGDRSSAFLSSPLASGRQGWSQGRGECSSTWTARIGDAELSVTRARGMFAAEMPRPGGGIFHAGVFPTLAAAQIAIEGAARRFAARRTPPTDA